MSVAHSFGIEDLAMLASPREGAADVPVETTSRLLLSLRAAVNQGLLTVEQQESLQNQLLGGDIAVVEEILLAIGVCDVQSSNGPSSCIDDSNHIKLCGAVDDAESFDTEHLAKKQRAGGADVSVDTSRLLLSLAAAVEQGLLSVDQRESLQEQLSSGDAHVVNEIVLAIGVREVPGMVMESAEAKWECMICFTEQRSHGWLCPEQHRFCVGCMTHHVDAVPFPRCPQCSYSLIEDDLMLLNVSPSRIEAFNHATLCGAVDTIARSGEALVRCSRAECMNAVVMPSGRGRQRFSCSVCTAPAFCTQCRQTPYHYHAECDRVQSLRQQWVAWISGGRDDYFGRARAAEVSDERNRALHDAISRHNELEADEQWKAANCRLCPGCSRPISKIEGCDSMVCGRNYHGGGQQPGCGSEFDWAWASPYVVRLERHALPHLVTDNIGLRGRSAFHPFTDCCLCSGERRGIAGVRFRCIHCDAFDLCSECEPKLTHFHEQDHVFEILFESDLRCPWLPKGTRVRIVRSGERLPRSRSRYGGGELEGQFGKITARRRPPVEGYSVELEMLQGSVELELDFLEPVITSRADAEKLLTHTLENDGDPQDPAPVAAARRVPAPRVHESTSEEEGDFADDSPLWSEDEGDGYPPANRRVPQRPPVAIPHPTPAAAQARRFQGKGPGRGHAGARGS